MNAKALPSFEIVDHTADWAIHVRGRDLHELLLNAARGMTSLLVADPAHIPNEVERRFELQAMDEETLLVDWLSELAYLAEAQQLVFSDYHLEEIAHLRWQAVVRGGRAPELQKHIKAVTYHNLEIVPSADGLETTIVFDV